MTQFRQVGADRWELVREIRLRALVESPDWFWATYEQEKDKPEDWWRGFVEAGAWFIAFDGSEPVGIAAAIRADPPRSVASELISMWVDPRSRGRGVGEALVHTVIAWARSAGLEELQLEVTENNEAARRLYERCGFVRTGRTQPLPRDPSLIEHEMVLGLSV